MKDFLTLFLSGLLACLLFNWLDGQDPRLMGFGCEGAHGVLYAMEESDFPKCSQIAENK